MKMLEKEKAKYEASKEKYITRLCEYLEIDRSMCKPNHPIAEKWLQNYLESRKSR